MLALGLATLLAVGVTLGLYRILRRGYAGHPELTPVVFAAKDLSAGEVLSGDDVKLTDWPVGGMLPGSFSKTEDVLNHPLLYPVGAKEPILRRDLAEEGSGLGLSVKIPQGMRATSVRSNEVVGVAGFLYPGSHVDVLATLTLSGSAGSVTQTILQDVQVLTAGEEIEPDPQGKPQAVNVVTLLLDSEDSQKLLLASAQGSIQFVLRNSADRTKAPVDPTSLSQLLPAPAQAPAISDKASAPVRAASPAENETSGVEIIRGDTRTEEKF